MMFRYYLNIRERDKENTFQQKKIKIYHYKYTYYINSPFFPTQIEMVPVYDM